MVVCSLKKIRDTDIITIRNGKNDSSTLAATENAYTCTSVFMQYRNVPASPPARRRMSSEYSGISERRSRFDLRSWSSAVRSRLAQGMARGRWPHGRVPGSGGREIFGNRHSRSRPGGVLSAHAHRHAARAAGDRTGKADQSRRVSDLLRTVRAAKDRSMAIV